MIEFFLISRFVGSILTLVVGAAIIWFIRKKTKQKADGYPAGLWMRALCFGTDLAIIDILNLFIAYHGSLMAAGYISLLTTASYFFFFWLFFSTTPVQLFARIKIVSKDGGPLKIWQALTRLGMTLFLFVGWITILFDKKEKNALHDIVAQTKVIYSSEGIKLKTKEGLVKILQFSLMGAALILMISLMSFGSGEKMTKYAENSQIKFFDLNSDTVPEGLTMDLNQDGKIDVFKYDLNNDRVVDFATFDADSNGVAESIDVNNDGRIDGFDFNNDNKLDIKVFDGQFFIWLWRVWFGVLGVGFTALLAFAILKESCPHMRAQ